MYKIYVPLSQERSCLLRWRLSRTIQQKQIWCETNGLSETWKRYKEKYHSVSKPSSRTLENRITATAYSHIRHFSLFPPFLFSFSPQQWFKRTWFTHCCHGLPKSIHTIQFITKSQLRLNQHYHDHKPDQILNHRN